MKLRSGGRGGASFEGAATEKMEKICSQKGRAKKIRKKERNPDHVGYQCGEESGKLAGCLLGWILKKVAGPISLQRKKKVDLFLCG